MDRIIGKLREGGADDEAQRLIMDEMRKPLDLDALVRDIPNEQVAAEVYAVSLFAIEVDTPEERAYLERLANVSGLDEEVTAQLRASLNVA